MIPFDGWLLFNRNVFLLPWFGSYRCFSFKKKKKTSDKTWGFKNIWTYYFSLIFNVTSETVVRSMLDENVASIFKLLSPTTSQLINNHYPFLLCFESCSAPCDLEHSNKQGDTFFFFFFTTWMPEYVFL